MGLHTGRETQNPDNVFNLIAEQLGPIQSVYLTGDAPDGDPELEQPTFKGGIERDKMKKRSDLKKTTEPSENESIQKIFKRVRPVLKTLGNQAVSQIMRTARRYMDGGNFEGAQKAATVGNKLKKFLISLDTSNDINIDDGYGSANRDFSQAIIKSLEQASGSRRGTDSFKQWLGDAANGNSAALKPVLDGLRDTLVSMQ
jgi:hypothetical protein